MANTVVDVTVMHQDLSAAGYNDLMAPFILANGIRLDVHDEAPQDVPNWKSADVYLGPLLDTVMADRRGYDDPSSPFIGVLTPSEVAQAKIHPLSRKDKKGGHRRVDDMSHGPHAINSSIPPKGSFGTLRMTRTSDM